MNFQKIHQNEHTSDIIINRIYVKLISKGNLRSQVCLLCEKLGKLCGAACLESDA